MNKCDVSEFGQLLDYVRNNDNKSVNTTYELVDEYFMKRTVWSMLKDEYVKMSTAEKLLLAKRLEEVL